MHILVTNDDGVTAPGLLSLAQAMRPLGRITVLAPERNWTAGGHVKTLHRPLRVRPTRLDDGTQALTSDGAPSDCVALALLGLIEEKIDLVVSGINTNANMGHDITYSGTVTAAMEAVIAGVPGIAFSLVSPAEHQETLDYGPAGQIARTVVSTVLEQGLEKNTLLNVNIPYLQVEQMEGVQITRQGLRVYRDALDHRLDPRGRDYYWIGGEYPSGVAEDGTDIGAVEESFVSITPLQLDLTDYKLLDRLRDWRWEL
ncbi:MAG: 5'/3'-nucleotidase SurE [Candidatus Promineifilaceae bacterium]|nr:5'/3'-nucleotidase SurE [Candidatus Promineifilaceae bacterium]